MPRVYLGDGCYVEMERDMVRLSTSNGYCDTNSIFMEPEVLRNFDRWRKMQTNSAFWPKSTGSA